MAPAAALPNLARLSTSDGTPPRPLPTDDAYVPKVVDDLARRAENSALWNKFLDRAKYGPLPRTPAEARADMKKHRERAEGLDKAYSYSDNMLVQLRGMKQISPNAGEIVLRHARDAHHANMKAFFAASNPADLGLGHDTTEYMPAGTSYTKIVPIATFDVDYSASKILEAFHQAQKGFRNAASNDCPSAKPLTLRTDKAWANQPNPDRGITSQGTDLNEVTGEKYMFHGTSAQAVESILNSNFDLKRARPGWYGKAIYFADDPSKSDQYARTDRTSAEPRVEALLRRLGITADQWRNQAVTSVHGDKEVFFMFVVRVALGCTADLSKDRFDANKCPSDSTEPDDRLFLDADQPPRGNQMNNVTQLNPDYNSVSVKAYKEGGKGKAFMRFRETTVYDSAVARITHLVAYVRAGAASDAEKKKMGEEWVDRFAV